jgi:aminopeptidase N
VNPLRPTGTCLRLCVIAPVLAFVLMPFVVLPVVLAGLGDARAERLSPASGLPRTVIPVHYAIELEPDLQNDRVAGSATIHLEVREPTERLVLNAVDVVLRHATIDSSEQHPAIAMNAAAQTATLTFAQPLAAGPHELRLTFAARINKFRSGLFMIEYRTAAGTQRMLASHFKPIGARRLFPCFDDPAFKATIALTVTVPRTDTAISNMPIAQEEPVTPVLKQVTFARTPPIATNSFALFVGRFERSMVTSGETVVSAITAVGKHEQARFALAHAARLVRYFNGYFGFKYPLPKLDLLALPGGIGELVDAWGVIALPEAHMLIDRATSASSARRSMFAMLALNTARQWLGNLVTSSREDLWLTEAVAGFIESKAAERFFPRWRIEIDLHAAKEFAMQSDARRSSRALQSPSITAESEALADIDEIAVGKGQALIRMLERTVGRETFQEGIRTYVARHAYGRATPADLWQALEAVSARPVRDIARSFTEQAGFPLVTVQTRCLDGKQSIALRPQSFAASPHSWLVPVTIGRARARSSAESFLLREENEIFFGACGEPIKVNFDDSGYYRVQYDAASISSLWKSFAFLNSDADRMNLLDDTWALVEAAHAEPRAYLGAVEEISPGEERGVYEQMIRTFARLDWLARGRPERADLQVYARAKLRPVLDRLGLDPIIREDEESSILRARIFRTLGEFNDPAVVGEARRRFGAFMRNASAVSPELRDPVIHVVGLHADRATYETLLALARTSEGAQDQLRYYSAAASARDPLLARANLDLILTEEIPDWLKPPLLQAIASAGQQPELVWDFLQKHFAALAGRPGASFRASFVADIMRNFSDAEHAQALATFAPALASPGARAAAERAYETILADAAFKERALPAVAAWIAGNGWQH